MLLTENFAQSPTIQSKLTTKSEWSSIETTGCLKNKNLGGC